MVNRGWQDAIAYGHQANDHFCNPGCGDQMPHHAFGAGNWGELGSVTKDSFACHGLGAIVHCSARAVSVNISDFLDVEFGVADGLSHATDSAAALWMNVGDAICVRRASVTKHFAVDLCATFACVLIFFQDHNRSALTQNETVPFFVERSGGFGWIAVSLRQGGQQAKAR